MVCVDKQPWMISAPRTALLITPQFQYNLFTTRGRYERFVDLHNVMNQEKSLVK